MVVSRVSGVAIPSFAHDLASLSCFMPHIMYTLSLSLTWADSVSLERIYGRGKLEWSSSKQTVCLDDRHYAYR